MPPKRRLDDDEEYVPPAKRPLRSNSTTDLYRRLLQSLHDQAANERRATAGTVLTSSGVRIVDPQAFFNQRPPPGYVSPNTLAQQQREQQHRRQRQEQLGLVQTRYFNSLSADYNPRLLRNTILFYKDLPVNSILRPPRPTRRHTLGGSATDPIPWFRALRSFQPGLLANHPRAQRARQHIIARARAELARPNRPPPDFSRPAGWRPARRQTLLVLFPRGPVFREVPPQRAPRLTLAQMLGNWPFPEETEEEKKQKEEAKKAEAAKKAEGEKKAEQERRAASIRMPPPPPRFVFGAQSRAVREANTIAPVPASAPAPVPAPAPVTPSVGFSRTVGLVDMMGRIQIIAGIAARDATGTRLPTRPHFSAPERRNSGIEAPHQTPEHSPERASDSQSGTSTNPRPPVRQFRGPPTDEQIEIAMTNIIERCTILGLSSPPTPEARHARVLRRLQCGREREEAARAALAGQGEASTSTNVSTSISTTVPATMPTSDSVVPAASEQASTPEQVLQNTTQASDIDRDAREGCPSPEDRPNPAQVARERLAAQVLASMGGRMTSSTTASEDQVSGHEDETEQQAGGKGKGKGKKGRGKKRE